eukprot:CAMPEP_0178980276 /NCGR_PEP_ID=MMETSP0789-20121207/26395_1 /TAXON_ID=3005 /ORGANISM="Rhizosolenia setigera, Strain CCMP 1694" /LENGTH=1092 /DNA_ID=CAMNT_0020670649 /DNA_START=112 /DNA_END=3388 /DNA_ORIENTATION=+
MIFKQKVTCSPVNRFGYPAGYGITVGEQRGPYLYVLAEVTSKCYGEDAKYYVVKRCDTGMEQRADAKWMWKDPIKKDDKVMAIALRAAKQNLKNRHLRENEEDLSKRFIPNKSGPFTRISKWFSRNIGDPWMSLRRTMKHHVTLMIMGLSPYAIQIRITGVNVLEIRLVLHGPQYDYGIITLSAVIWVILALELCAEVAIRPEGYSALIQGEKKYKPSTARYINRFHLVCESLALLFFLPELQCLSSAEKSCDEEYPFSLLYAIRGILLQEHIFTSYFIIIVMKLRIFGLVRHWKQMKFNRSIFEIKGKGDIRNVKGNEASRRISEVTKIKSNKKDDDEREDSDLEEDREDGDAVGSSEEEQELNNADKIGTALMVVNSHRAMIILMIMACLQPLTSGIRCVTIHSQDEHLKSFHNTATQLQDANLYTKDDKDKCMFLQKTSCISLFPIPQNYILPSEVQPTILKAVINPVRCDFQNEREGLITSCDIYSHNQHHINHVMPSMYLDETVCAAYNRTSHESDNDELAEIFDKRRGALVNVKETYLDNSTDTDYTVEVVISLHNDIYRSAVLIMLLQFFLFATLIVVLGTLDRDARRLVIGPLKRMLKIVIHYAHNPLTPVPAASNDRKDKDQLGNYETEQLINTITKITDLLRKCWGVAGAGIISSNLAKVKGGSTVEFNLCVPGKSVYALFGFAGITDFPKHLAALDSEIIELINNIAKVIHEEVERWSKAKLGQCNKNLGNVFLLVYRIGERTEVQEKLTKATNVIFENTRDTQKKQENNKSQLVRRRHKSAGSNHNAVSVVRDKTGDKRSDETVNLGSLPGISDFTDRAVFGLLKSFAGIHRDRDVLKWKDDFRLGAGVKAFSVDLIFGMDVGWAVEGAVGSEYKIDATYLSPHVNMASRMMTATKQYGIYLLISQAVENLLSENARSKFRHVDTVTVKGSNLQQKIFTYDARYKNVNFFLFDRHLGDNFGTDMWDKDKDLTEMRRHVTDEFLDLFCKGRDYYLGGNWTVAKKYLKLADYTMIKTILDDGTVEYEVQTSQIQQILSDENGIDDDEDIARLRVELGDGPSRRLLAYMEDMGGVPPKDWQGY